MRSIAASLFMLLLVLAPSAYSAEKATPRSVTAPIVARIPEGLYMAEPARQHFDGAGAYAPLFIVKDGRLIDPYAEVLDGEERIGDEDEAVAAFLRERVKGREFYVMVGEKRIGAVKRLDLPKDDGLSYCGPGYGYYLPLRGRYKGDDFNKLNPLKSHLHTSGRGIDGIIELGAVGGWRPAATPKGYAPQPSREEFTVNDDDVKAVIDAAKARFSDEVAAALAGRIRKGNESGVRILSKREYDHAYLRAFDVDGNGKRDFIGDYYQRQSYKHPEAKLGDVKWEGAELIYFISDAGAVEKIADGIDATELSILWLVDVDMDGFHEVVIRSRDFRGAEYPGKAFHDPGWRVSVMRRTPDGWKSVYRSIPICGDTPW